MKKSAPLKPSGINNESIIYGVVGLIAGILITGFSASYAVNNDRVGIMRMMGMHTNSNSIDMMDSNDMTMSEMSSELKNKSGDAFDKAFLSEMIAHHQGAINMANMAKQNAKHDEIKNLADNILSAQSKEIDTMQTWQAQWGYKNTPSTQSNTMMDMGN